MVTLWQRNMDFKLENQEDVPKEKKVLQQVEITEKVIGETTLEDLEAALKRHKELRDQELMAIEDLENQITKAKAVLASK
jgi:hypothetical protein